MANCATCSLTGSGSFVCASCSASYFVSASGTCTACFGPSCQSCTGTTYATCTACQAKSYLDDSKQNCTACTKQSCAFGSKAYGICTGHSNPQCIQCDTAFAWSCSQDPAYSTRTPPFAPFWPDQERRASCCAAQASVSNYCTKYINVITCTGLWTEYPYAPPL
jgi:hypothetical protein